MNHRVKVLGEEVRKLTLEERLDLVEDILSSLGNGAGEHDDAWIKEIENRIAGEAAGEARMVPADEVFAKHRRP